MPNSLCPKNERKISAPNRNKDDIEKNDCTFFSTCLQCNCKYNFTSNQSTGTVNKSITWIPEIVYYGCITVEFIMIFNILLHTISESKFRRFSFKSFILSLVWVIRRPGPARIRFFNCFFNWASVLYRNSLGNISG